MHEQRECTYNPIHAAEDEYASRRETVPYTKRDAQIDAARDKAVAAACSMVFEGNEQSQFRQRLEAATQAYMGSLKRIAPEAHTLKADKSPSPAVFLADIARTALTQGAKS